LESVAPSFWLINLHRDGATPSLRGPEENRRMSLKVPKPIAAYFAADRGDSATFAQCFTEDAIVRDEGQTYEGLAAIRQWKVESQKKYRYAIEPLASAEKEGKTIVTSRLTGNFPGSPINLQFIFEIDGNKIASLEIHP
jgi:hypothetical protein